MFNKVKGFRDIFGEEILYWQQVERNFKLLFKNFGFEEYKIPVIEKSEIFERGIGDTTDIVEKEMFTFNDRDGSYLSLRPEGTASVVRGYIENKLYYPDAIKKLYYYGPMFRRERPQRGRYRQFYQVGVEAFGSESPAMDADVINLLVKLFQMCDIYDFVKLEVNSLGCSQCRKDYKDKLISYFKNYLDELCEDCRRRIIKNPLRILDCKASGCTVIAKDAPNILDNICEDCKEHFSKVLNYLSCLGIEYDINPRMVRGLDYYVRTTFEIVTDMLGASNAVGAGGRYDGLVSRLGGPDIPGVGFAVGVDRLAAIMSEKAKKSKGPKKVFILSFMGVSDDVALKLLDKLRSNNITAEIDYAFSNMRTQMKRANRADAKYVIILGEDEIKYNKASVKDMETGTQKPMEINCLVDFLKSNLKGV